MMELMFMMEAGVFALLVFLLVWFVPTIVVVYGDWIGLRRTGYAGAWSLLMLVPVVNIIAIWIFAFAGWPVDARARAAQTPPPPPPPGY